MEGARLFSNLEAPGHDARLLVWKYAKGRRDQRKVELDEAGYFKAPQEKAFRKAEKRWVHTQELLVFWREADLGTHGGGKKHRHMPHH